MAGSKVKLPAPALPPAVLAAGTTGAPTVVTTGAKEAKEGFASKVKERPDNVGLATTLNLPLTTAAVMKYLQSSTGTGTGTVPKPTPTPGGPTPGGPGTMQGTFDRLEAEWTAENIAAHEKAEAAARYQTTAAAHRKLASALAKTEVDEKSIGELDSLSVRPLEKYSIAGWKIMKMQYGKAVQACQKNKAAAEQKNKAAAENIIQAYTDGVKKTAILAKRKRDYRAGLLKQQKLEDRKKRSRMAANKALRDEKTSAEIRESEFLDEEVEQYEPERNEEGEIMDVDDDTDEWVEGQQRKRLKKIVVEEPEMQRAEGEPLPE